MEIVELIKPQENEPNSKLDFESDNSLNEEEEERNFIKQEENEPRNKTFLQLEKLVQPLEIKINPYNILKDLKTIIEKTHLEIKT